MEDCMNLQPMFFKDCPNCNMSTVWTALEQVNELEQRVECDECQTTEIMPRVAEDLVNG